MVGSEHGTPGRDPSRRPRAGAWLAALVLPVAIGCVADEIGLENHACPCVEDQGYVCDEATGRCVSWTSDSGQADAGPLDGGPRDAGVPDAGPPDSGPPDSGPVDAGPPDAGPPDAGPPDSGPVDAGPRDAGPSDAGPPDAGLPDSGPVDAGPRDAGPPDAGPPDAGPPDAGPPDAGPPDAGPPDAGSPCDLGRSIRIVGLELPYLAAGAQRTIAVEVRDAADAIVSNPPVSAWSDDPSTAEATVDLVTGFSRGWTTIHADCGLLTTSAPITILPPAQILFVHDDGSDDPAGGAPDVSGVYLDDLAALGFIPDTQTIAFDASLPGAESLSGYHLVVWACGLTSSNTLTPADSTALTTYLDSGGRLFLSAQDYLYDLVDNMGAALGTFENVYLGVVDFTDDAARIDGACPSVALTGNSDHAVSDGLTFLLPDADADCIFDAPFSGYDNYSDAIYIADPPDNTTPLFTLDTYQDQPAAVLTRTSTFATLFAAFPYEVIEDPIARRTFLARAIDNLVDQIP